MHTTVLAELHDVVAHVEAETEAVRLLSVGTKLLSSTVSGARALGGVLAPNAVVIIGML